MKKQMRAPFDPIPPKDLISKSTIVYGAMSVIGLLVLTFGHESLKTVLSISAAPMENLRLAVIGMIGAGLLHILSYFFQDWFPSYRELKAVVMHMLGPLSVPAAFYIALITAFGEELVFRGAIQPVAGLFITSVLFGLMHVGPGGLLTSWSLWAMIAGGLLGWMFDETRSLWPPLVAHFLVNFISILSLRHSYQNWLKASQNQAAAPSESPPGGEKESDSRA